MKNYNKTFVKKQSLGNLKLRGSDGKAKVVSKFSSFFSTANLGGLVKVFLD